MVFAAARADTWVRPYKKLPLDCNSVLLQRPKVILKYVEKIPEEARI